jgi:hypothetical protein
MKEKMHNKFFDPMKGKMKNLVDIDSLARYFEGRDETGSCPPEKSKSYDYINPDHYKKYGKEVWEITASIWGKEAYIAHCEMSAFEYRMRLGSKPDQPVERDLKKAQWYEDKAKELRGE